jgi:hypothetical protein
MQSPSDTLNSNPQKPRSEATTNSTEARGICSEEITDKVMDSGSADDVSRSPSEDRICT